MRYILTYMTIIVVMFSCSPQKKLQRLVNKHPELMQKDTIFVEIHDTIYIESTSFDTITQLFGSDTIITIDNSTLTLKYFYDTITKNIYHDVLIKKDTIFYEREISVPIEKIVIQELTWWQKNNQWVIFLVVLFTLAHILQKIKKVLPL